MFSTIFVSFAYIGINRRDRKKERERRELERNNKFICMIFVLFCLSWFLFLVWFWSRIANWDLTCVCALVVISAWSLCCLHTKNVLWHSRAIVASCVLSSAPLFSISFFFFIVDIIICHRYLRLKSYITDECMSLYRWRNGVFPAFAMENVCLS